MLQQEELVKHCPYCGESIDLLIDASAGNQQYIEDCSVCCQPINLCVQVGEADDVPLVTAFRDDD